MIVTDYFDLLVKRDRLSYCIHDRDKVYDLSLPIFSIDGRRIAMSGDFSLNQEIVLPNGVRELTYLVEEEGLSFQIILRITDKSPIIKFRFRVFSQGEHRLTKENGRDSLRYVSFQPDAMSILKEVRFSEYNHIVHSYCLSEAKAFEHDDSIMGPMLVELGDSYSALIAYEHGSQYPNKFLAFGQEDDVIVLKAVKGNYYHNQPLTGLQCYETIWLQFGAVSGDEEILSGLYREFMLLYTCPHLESRKPYIYYNTWAFQERNKEWYHHKYLDSMKYDRIVQEIDVAYRMGIDVFVLDTGWFEKAGDWTVNIQRFPDGLHIIKSKLDEYGMKMGLWFNPLAAAVSSKIYKDNQQCVTSINGITNEPKKIWESEESYLLCLVSEYWERFAERLIYLAKVLGVTYFKWDAIDQYGCNDGCHLHGTHKNSLEERSECYAFNIGIYMSKVVDRLCDACPDAIVDFDITEGTRYVGLGFLSSGKYFLINNGPYYNNYDIPARDDVWSNIFVYPGHARGWICRTPLTFDKWIPSVLFLTHYLPDDPQQSQLINLASLVLGQNGIWGDLLSVTNEGITLFHEVLSHYKTIADDITHARINHYGIIGSSLEVYEKVNQDSGKGVISVFCCTKGEYTYKTDVKVPETALIKGDVAVMRTHGKTVLCMSFKEPGAALIMII